MKNLTNLTILLALSAAGLVACGDDAKKPDAAVHIDAPDIDAPAGFPAAPTLGTQIDRMGRPAVNTALNSPIADDPLKTAKKDVYNHAADPTMWATTQLDSTMTMDSIKNEFKGTLGILDALDQGSGLTGTTAGPGGGCGNGALYSATVPPAMTAGYTALAGVLADDELYVDTNKLTCNNYLSVEFDVVAGSHSQCGGRTPSHDVIDVSYSLLAAGVNGFNLATLTPLVTDGAPVHADVSDSAFPFLGAPH